MVKLSYAVAGNHRIVPKEARLKMAVFHEALDYPAVVLRNGFAEAIKRFKWFPAVAELREIMDPIHRRLLACRDEAHDFATHELPPPEPKSEPIDAEVSAEVEKLLSGFKRPARAPALESLDPARAARALKGFRRIPMLWRGETEETGENDG